jgi:signal transduction histidine kinase
MDTAFARQHFFSIRANVFIGLVCVLFIITNIVTFFLSNSITRPIEKLSVFASKIGHGDFTPVDFQFKDKEFESLNIALNNSAKQLGIYDNEKKAFFQNVSHELRTPLMSIQCQAEGISFGLMEPKKASETILFETQRLSDLVADLLYISKIDNITTVYKTTSVNLPEIIRSCAQRQELVAEKKGIRFTFDFIETTVEYECAGELISRAVDNLISNAIRYASTEIVLSCNRDQNQITICVADNGCGIEPDCLPFIFERFYKSNGGNHGIGLSIVKSIAEQHHGSITAKNKTNGGAEFIMTLPLKNMRQYNDS